MSGNTFVAQDWSWIFDGCSNVEILARRVVRGDKVKTSLVLVVNTRSVHETARTCRFECLRQLTNFKSTEVRRQSNQFIGFQKVDHLRLATLVSLEKRFLISGDVFAPCRIWIRECRIRKHRLKCTIPGKF